MDGKCLKSCQVFLNEDFIKSYIEESGEGYFLHNDLPFLAEIMNIKKVVANLYDTEEYAIHIRNLKQILKFELILKKVHRIIKFSKKTRLKSYIL